MNLPVYLDNAATTSCDPQVVDAMLPYFTKFFGNSGSSAHGFGWAAAGATDKARKQVASAIGSLPEEVIFTSGATEACNLAIRGVSEAYQTKGSHILTTATEHKAVLSTLKALQKKGAEVEFLKVDANGLVSPEELEKAIKPSTVFIAVMYANNETGAIQPVKEIGRIAHTHNILFFCDATQALGKIPMDVLGDHIDLAAFSAHKINGPKGVGALFQRKKRPMVKLMPQITGGGQEGSLRSGTLNVPGIVGFGKAAELAVNGLPDSQRIEVLRDKLERSLLQIEETVSNSRSPERLPNIANLSFRYLHSSRTLAALSTEVAVSSGSACNSGSLDPSYVLKAMGIDDDLAKSAIRFSLGRFTTEEEIDFTIKAVYGAVEKLRSDDPVWKMYKQGILK